MKNIIINAAVALIVAVVVVVLIVGITNEAMNEQDMELELLEADGIDCADVYYILSSYQRHVCAERELEAQ